MVAFLIKKPIGMKFGLLLLLTVTTITLSVAIPNSPNDTKAPSADEHHDTPPHVNKTGPVLITGNKTEGESEGFLHGVTTNFEKLACKVGLFCSDDEKKKEAAAEKEEKDKSSLESKTKKEGEEKKDEKQKVTRAESPAKNSQESSSSPGSSSSHHHDPETMRTTKKE